jgi:hypothetical protein
VLRQLFEIEAAFLRLTANARTRPLAIIKKLGQRKKIREWK